MDAIFLLDKESLRVLGSTLKAIILSCVSCILLKPPPKRKERSPDVLASLQPETYPDWWALIVKSVDAHSNESFTYLERSLKPLCEAHFLTFAWWLLVALIALSYHFSLFVRQLYRHNVCQRFIAIRVLQALLCRLKSARLIQNSLSKLSLFRCVNESGHYLRIFKSCQLIVRRMKYPYRNGVTYLLRSAEPAQEQSRAEEEDSGSSTVTS